MKHGHTKLVVCLRVRHKWDTDTRWTSVRHVSDTRSYVSHLKNIIFRLRHASDTTKYASDTRRHDLDARRTRLDTAHIWPEYNLILFFPIIWWTKKEFKDQKTQVHLEILFELSIEIVSHIFWKGYRKHT